MSSQSLVGTKLMAQCHLHLTGPIKQSTHYFDSPSCWEFEQFEARIDLIPETILSHVVSRVKDRAKHPERVPGPWAAMSGEDG